MRKSQLMALGALTAQPTKNCHPPFVPTKPGKYLVRRCGGCGNAVSVFEDPSVQGGIFEIDARPSARRET